MPAPKVKFVDAEALTDDPKNARKHSPEQIEHVASLIRRLGWTRPIFTDVSDDHMIVMGHGARQAALAMYEAGETIYLAPGEARGGSAIPKGKVPIIDVSGWTPEERTAANLSDNRSAELSTWDYEMLAAQASDLSDSDFGLADLGFDDLALEAIAGNGGGVGGPVNDGKSGAGSLAAEFLAAPFTVLSAREGWWMQRKRAWLALGIKSEVGRGENLLKMSDTMLEPDPVKRAAKKRATAAAFDSGSASGDRQPGETTGDRIFRQGKGKKKGLGGVTMDALSSHPRYYEQKTAAEKKLGRKLTPEEFERDHWVLPDSELSSGTSIFDPVLCELAYRWFSPPNGRVLDPFAGGSVRGIVAGALGREYVGIDLRPEQTEANAEQWPSVAEQLAQIEAGEPVKPIWHTGDSNAVLDRKGKKDEIGKDFDFIFSCPPYGDLEVYSDDPADISTLDMDGFDAIYAEIIAKAVARLADDRFACFVVGDYRDKRGIYANFVSKTIAAFEAAGAMLYNEAILVTSVGSLPIRTAKQFRAGRKLGKTHQNILVFVKGNPRQATEALGPVDTDAGLNRVLAGDLGEDDGGEFEIVTD